MTLTVTIGGVTKTIRDGSLQISKVANGRDVCRFKVVSTDASYRPAIGAEIVITCDGEVIFAGTIIIPRETGAGNQPITPIVTEIQAVSFKALADRIYITATVADGTALETFIDALVSAGHFTDIGITKSGSQVTGPNLPAMSFDGVRLSDVFDQLSKATNYVWDIDDSKVFSMFEPSAVAAPFNVTATTNTYGDITVEQSRDKYANRVTVRAGNPGIQQITDTFTGDGTTTTYTLGAQMVYIPVVGRGYVTSAGIFETLGLSGATWIYDPATNTITRSSAPANGDAISITYDAQFPIFVTAQDAADIAANGLYTYLHNEPNVYNRAQALTIATNLLAILKNTIKTVMYTTRTAGLVPGMTQTITHAPRNISGTFYIQLVSISNLNKDYLSYAVTAIGGSTPFVSYWHDQYLRWLGGGGGGSSFSVTTLPPQTTGGSASSAVYVASRTFTHAEIMTLDTVPITVVPAPGTGKCNIPILMTLNQNFTVAYGQNVRFEMCYEVVAPNSAGPQLGVTNVFNTQQTVEYLSIVPQLILATEMVKCENRAIQARAEFTISSGGDAANTMTMTIVYLQIDV